jgi:formylglycine-generating enzyme
MIFNAWQGEFPWENLRIDRCEGTSPVETYPPNGYGLYGATGKVWEWTTDYFSPRHPNAVAKPCCVPRNPQVDSPEGSRALGQPGAHIPRKVMCYRPAARQGEAVDTSTSHIGFCCVVRGA